MARYIFDIETNGFLDVTTTIHCLMMKDVDTGKSYDYSDQKYGPGSIARGIKRLAEATLLIGHNILKFDVPVINKLYPGTLPFGLNDLHRYFDTLVVSRLIWTNLKEEDADRRRKPGSTFPPKLTGAHKLEAWGYRLGLQKGEYGKDEDGKQVEGCWEFWNQEMHDYCVLDVEVTHKLYLRILKENFAEAAITLEHAFAFCMAFMEANGITFNEAEAAVLYSQLVARRVALTATLETAFPPEVIPETFIPKVNNKARGYVKGVPFTKYHTVVFNPSSRQQVARRLAALGWVPTDFTPSGEPKVDDEVLSGLPWPEAQVLAEYFMVEKRIGSLAEGDQAWLKCVRNGRIHGAINPMGTPTSRCTHSNPNMSQVPAVDKPYGEAMRAMFGPRKGFRQVGIDMSGIQLRALAHFMARWDGGAYGKIILEGDMHWTNATAMGFVSGDRDKHSKLHDILRSGAKTFIYMFLFGGGDLKAGKIVYSVILSLKENGFPWEEMARKFFGSTAAPDADTLTKAGKKLKANFLKGLPALKMLRDSIVAKCKAGEKFKGLDGRMMYVRSGHAGLSVLLQGFEAVLMKWATVEVYRDLEAAGYKPGRDWAFIAHVHDEMQIECKPPIAEKVGAIAVAAMERAGVLFNSRIHITGEAKTGANWKECH